MSEFVFIYSACGESGAFVDIFDLEANPHGVVCCGNCESIIASRENWYVTNGVSI